MKIHKVLLLCFTMLFVTACFEDNDDNAITASEINDFVWKAMNAVYLYQADVPDLANDRFTSDEQYGEYLNSFSSPEALFETILFDPLTVDRFSFIIPDYIALEDFLAGTSTTNGLRFYSFEDPQNSEGRILVVNYVAKGSTGETANVKRGDYFNQVDGVTITANNINDLLSSNSYTLHYADYDNNNTPETGDDSFTSNGETVSLNKEVLTENPVNVVETLQVNNENVGYLMYRRFNSDFIDELNNAFGTFAANNVQHLVLDLRYNGGGSVQTASFLASMITGQYTGETFSKLFYNDNLQNNNTTFEFVNNFNSLNLDKVYVLTTDQTASASELIINSLRPWMSEVIQIGGTTEGKTQASLTVYDSPGLFTKENINPNHAYAMQPLIANSTNVNNVEVPLTGLTPNIPLSENAYNLGTLGDANEPFLAAALADISGNADRLAGFTTIEFPDKKMKSIGFSNPYENEMFLDLKDFSLKLKE